MIFFFFSSRRRHTRWPRDWSSDVCSSDLGQQKSYLIALKLAQLELIKQNLNVTPLLLLDDIFDKLDESRVEQLISLVNDDHFGQIFISDTHPERTEAIVTKINSESKIFRL